MYKFALGPQPGQQQIQWMQAPQAPPGCPQGLEYLTQIDQLLVHQQVELLESKLINLNMYQKIRTLLSELQIVLDLYIYKYNDHTLLPSWQG